MYRSNRGFKQKRRPFSRPLAIAGAVLLSLIVLEILLRAFVWITGQWSEFAAYEGDRKIVTAYRLKFLDRGGTPYDGLPNRGRLALGRSVLTSYKLLGAQQSDFWRINEQGFRADLPVPPKKPPGEFRIFLLGGSTAFGYLSLNNQTTIASQLESLLNQQIDRQKKNPEKFRPATLPYFKDQQDKALALPPRIRDAQYRVINAGVPGYASGNELAQLAFQILAYEPNIIVVLDGYADLMLPSTEEGTDIPGAEHFLENSSAHFTNSLSQGLSNWIANTFLIKGVQYWVLRPHRLPQEQSANQLSLVAAEKDVPLAKHLPANAEELQRRVKRYRYHLQQMARLSVAAKIPLIVVVQPEITGRGKVNPNPKEQEILKELGEAYVQGVEAGYAELKTVAMQLEKEFPKGMTVLNGYALYGDFGNDRAFQDAIHLTDEANKSLANRLYLEMAKSLQLSLSPETPPN